MANRLQGKRVVVTDATEFMGADIVDLFREEGAEVIADTRDLRATGACEALIAEAGHVDVLMANLAATFSGGLVCEVEDSELDLMFDRLVRPLHRLTRAVLPQMMARGAGKIVVVGSAIAFRGVPGRAAYAAARAAQHGYVRAVGIEAAPHGVNVTAIGQTFAENPSYFSPEYQATEHFRKHIGTLSAGRFSTRRKAAMFLLPLAESDWLFGQVFRDAGWYVQ